MVVKNTWNSTTAEQNMGFIRTMLAKSRADLDADGRYS